jgi:hypothetical protein
MEQTNRDREADAIKQRALADEQSILMARRLADKEVELRQRDGILNERERHLDQQMELRVNDTLTTRMDTYRLKIESQYKQKELTIQRNIEAKMEERFAERERTLISRETELKKLQADAAKEVQASSFFIGYTLVSR